MLYPCGTSDFCYVLLYHFIQIGDRIVLMIDEAHRTQGSDLGDNIFEAFPNAARIAFTGTPLITERHGEKKTQKRFGEYIDTYRRSRRSA